MNITIDEDDRPEAGAAACSGRLAGRLWRLFAVIIDRIIVMVLMLPLYWYFHVWQDVTAGVGLPLWISATFPVVGFAAFAGINFRLLERRGQTIGKRCAGIAIVGLDGTNKGAVHLLIYRFVPEMLFPNVPTVGWLFSLADTLVIFGRERRCLHDRIAGTKVILEME